MKRPTLALVPLALLLSLTGCGGSGTATDSGSPAGGSAANRAAAGLGSGSASVVDPAEPTAASAPFTPVGVFVTGTDAAQPTWGHVWASVYKVEGVGLDNKPITLFSSGEGFLLDLTQSGVLPGAGAALSSLPGMNRIRVTLAPAVQASKPDQSAVETISLLPALPKDADGRAVATLTLTKPFESGALALAVDLTKFVPNAGKAGLELSLGEAPKTALPVTVAGQLKGTTLLLPNGGRLALALESAQLANADGSGRPKLSDGAPALVEGALSADGKTITASRLTLGRPEDASLEGTPGSVDSKLGTFTLSLSRATGILPTHLTVSATLADKAVLRGRGGLPISAEAFLTALSQSGTRVRIEGSYEPATGALSVRRAWLLGKSLREATATGTVTAEPKTGALTLTQPTDWDGFAPGEKPLPLTTTEATLYLDEKGGSLTREAFLSALKEKSASAVGLLDGDGRLAATKLSLVAPLPKPEPEKKAAEPEKKATEPEKKPAEADKKSA